MRAAGLFTLLLPLAAAAQSTIDPGSPFAWSQNTGWAALHYDTSKAQGGITVGEYFLSGYAWGQNTGWIHFGSGSAQDGIRYGNAAAGDCGVTHDGAGGLGGFAWSQNTGWINFGWAGTADPNRPRIDLTTGKFYGFAWGQNTGWLNLETGLATLSVEIRDADSDGLDDSWETLHFTKLTFADALSDFDGDGETDVTEFSYGTDPLHPPLTSLSARGFTTDRKALRMEYPSTPSRFYRISASEDLQSWAPASDWMQGWPSLSEVKLSLDHSAPRQFYRLEAKRPLEP